MHQCLQCNTLVPDERRYCSKCGATQPLPRSPVKCEACGNELPGPMRFCKWCGAVQTKYDGANDPAATTALNSSGVVSPTTENLEAPTEVNATSQLQPNVTAPVLRQPPEPLEQAATTGELSPFANAPDSFADASDVSEETLVRPPRPASSYNNDSLTAPNFTATLMPVAQEIPVVATKKKQNLLPLVSVGVVALAVGTVMAFLLFQHFNRAPARESSAALPVVPMPLPIAGTRSTAPAPSAANPAAAALPPQIVIAASAPASSIAQGNTSINVQPPPAAVTVQSAIPNNTAAAAATAPARLPAGAPRGGVGEWSGTVLGSAIIEFSGRNQSVAGSALSLRSAHLSLDNGLPQAPSIVHVNKKKGRGQVTVVQQPSAANKYTARVQIGNGKDTAPENYVFDLTWESAAP